MYYLVEDFFTDRNQEILLHNLERMGLPYEYFKLIPFIDKFEFQSPVKDNAFLFGSVKAARFLNKEGYKPGSMYNDNHDFEVYGPKYGELMLNHGSHIMSFDSPLPEDDKWTMFFGRPCGDNKLFAGGVFMRHSWDDMVNEMLTRKFMEDETPEEFKIRTDRYRSYNVMISQLQEIKWEVRCWIVGGKVITMSQYKIGTRVVYDNKDHEDWLKNIVQSYVDIYQPAEAFVMDVCLVGEDVKIVEINCINAAGFYDANMQKLLNSIEEHFNPLKGYLEWLMKTRLMTDRDY